MYAVHSGNKVSKYPQPPALCTARRVSLLAEPSSTSLLTLLISHYTKIRQLVHGITTVKRVVPKMPKKSRLFHQTKASSHFAVWGIYQVVQSYALAPS